MKILKRIKVLIFILVIIVLVLIIGILELINHRSVSNNIEETNHTVTNSIEENIIEKDTSEEEEVAASDKEYSGVVIATSIYFRVESIINEYYNAIENEDVTTISNVLSKKYIQDNNIVTENKLLNIVKKRNNFSNFKAKEIYQEVYAIDGSYIYMYYVNGLTSYDNITEENYFLLARDVSKESYSIIPLENDENTKNNFETIIKKLNKETDQTKQNLSADYYEVEANNYNQFDSSGLDELQISQKYIDKYKFFCANDIEYIYNKISEKNKSLQFSTLDDWESYVDEHSEEIQNIKIKSYYADYNANFTRYVVKDTNDNYYIFDVSDVNNYTITIQ